MKALILAAGLGTRLMPLTKNQPKCMVEYQGKKIIDYEIEALWEAGIHEIAVVGGYLAEILKEYLVQKYAIKTFFENSYFDSTNMVATLFCAREWIESCISQQDDLIISYADIVYSKEVVKKLMKIDTPFGIIVDKQWRKLWEKRFDNPLDDAETLKIREGKVIEIGKKAKSYQEIEGQYIGLIKFSYRFLPQVLEFYESLNRNVLYDGKDFHNMFMTSFLQGLIDKYNNALAVCIDGGWCEIDSKKDLEIRL